MVELIVGSRGSGKTKRLIDAATSAAGESLGNVVCIEQGGDLGFSLKANEIRLIDIKEYSITGQDAYYGFISGLLAGNYDITHIFCDATFKIISGSEKDFGALEQFIGKVSSLGSKHDCKIVFSVSADEKNIPESMKAMIV